jgi:antitoxin PrlF
MRRVGTGVRELGQAADTNRLEGDMRKAAEILEIPATVTARGQTTVPAAIRKMLGLGKSGRVVFRGLADRTVVIAKEDDVGEDPVMGKFLNFLARDMTKEPRRIRPARRDMIERGKALVAGIDVELDSALPDDDA